MNQYQNKNEYEILESSQNNMNMPNRYPFADDPNAVMKNGNYKDWVNECEGSNISPSPAAAITSKIVSIVLKTLAKAVASSLADSIKSSLGISKTITENNVSQVSMVQVHQIINRRIQETILDLGESSLNGLVAIYNRDYLGALEAWNNNKSNINYQTNVAEAFKTVEREFFTKLKGIYRTSSSQITLLPTFTQAANLHLSMLRDAVMYQEGWNLQSHINYSKELDDALEDYTNYCVEVYTKGLNALRGSTAIDWLEFNSFRRDMTLMVLDLVAIFPNYNPVRYPLSTKISLSRKIYTDPVGRTDSPSFGDWTNTGRTLANFNDLEREVTDSPSLVKWLGDMTIYTGAIDSYRPTSPGDRIGVWYGNINAFYHTGRTDVVMFRQTGDTAYEDPSTFISNILYDDIYKLDLRAAAVSTIQGAMDTTFGVSSSRFFDIRGRNQLYQSNKPYPSLPITITFPGEESSEGNANDYSHLLCDVKNITGGLRQTSARGRSSLLSHAWTHASLDRNNTILPDEITQIPAVTAYELRGNSSVVAGPGSTGGDLVKMSYHSVWSFKVYCSELKNYRVRIRYASHGNCQFLMKRWPSTGVAPRQWARHNVQGTFSNSMRYEAFKYLDIFTITPEENNFAFTIDLESGGDLFIDKIEFIPVSGSAFEYEGKQ
ncbi:insecticidal delta-endotoxin Cry8Ea1 family protein, partial [Bacillus thuringiensis]|uniref:insecticidal delta-endotoxin Cry8Ea1 family protein n=1 Tax=Bacillus thuringiensis TaxID=1428 RepID=UPI000A3717C6